MGDKVRDLRYIVREGMVVKVTPAYLDVYVPSIGCVMMWPKAETELVAKANYVKGEE